MTDDRTITLVVTPSELQLAETALKLLEDTLTREEADELEEVQALLAKIRAARASAA